MLEAFYFKEVEVSQLINDIYKKQLYPLLIWKFYSS